MRIRKNAFTLVELLVVVAIIALLISILLPSLARAREEAKRTTCRANVAGIGKACYIYQEENLGIFPTAADSINNTGAILIAYVSYMGGHNNLGRDTPSQRTGPNPSTQLSTSRSLWLLVRSGAVVPKNFLCPSSDETADPTADVTRYYDFIGYGSLSYGYQIPYDDLNTCKPSVDVDPRMALMADKSPWSARGGTEADPGNVAFSGPAWFNDDLSPFSTALYTNGTDGLTDPSCAGVNLGVCNQDSPPEKWKRFNSPNHGGSNQGAGQNVLFPDGHANWYLKPTAGVDHDNIYTQMQTPGSGGSEFWNNVQWGVLPNAGGKIYPGHNSLGQDTSSFTDTLLWP